MTQIDPPRKVGEPQRKKTTMGVYVETKAKLGGLAKRWGTTLQEATRYLADAGQAGLIEPGLIPDGVLEARAIQFVDDVIDARLTEQAAKDLIVRLVRRAGNEARASWVEGRPDDN